MMRGSEARYFVINMLSKMAAEQANLYGRNQQVYRPGYNRLNDRFHNKKDTRPRVIYIRPSVRFFYIAAVCLPLAHAKSLFFK